jgi:hypothetical protein
VEIDGDVEAGAAQLKSQREVGAQAGKAGLSLRDDHLVDVRIVLDNRRCRWLDDIGDVGGLEAFPERSNGGRCEDDVTDLAKAN